jgi:hypothetical protein
MTKTPDGETYSEEETERRAARALQKMLNTPHKPHSKKAPPKPSSKA